MELRFCNKKDCKQVNPQPIEDFYKGSSYKGGRRPSCKKCIDEVVKNYSLKNPEVGKKAKKKWAETNRELSAFLKSEWQKNNPEKSRECKENYRINNPDKMAARQAKRKAM